MFCVDSCHILQRDEQRVKSVAEKELAITLVFAYKTVIPLDSGTSQRHNSAGARSFALAEGEHFHFWQKGICIGK